MSIIQGTIGHETELQTIELNEDLKKIANMIVPQKRFISWGNQMNYKVSVLRSDNINTREVK